MNLGLTDKIVCVAGSSRGIGRAIGGAFLREGARVVVSGRTKEDLDRTATELEKAYGAERVLPVRADLTDDVGITTCFQMLERRWGGLDILVANIGSGRSVSGWDVPREEWGRMLDLNLTVGALLTRKAIPLMQRRAGGSIVFIASLAGMEALPAPLPYACAKAGMVVLSKFLSRQLAGDHIRVNTVAPGNVLFPGGVWERKLKEAPEQVRAYISTDVPMRRMGTPEEIADAVMFLASARASFITGACLIVDGGQARGW
jgi:3-oxoacyl-[acyl-carrier protein] reductase